MRVEFCESFCYSCLQSARHGSCCKWMMMIERTVWWMVTELKSLCHSLNSKLCFACVKDRRLKCRKSLQNVSEGNKAMENRRKQ